MINNVWKDAHSLWIRYCGVSDELKALKSRWSFISRSPYSPLPTVDVLFSRLTDFDVFLARKFREIGLSRNMLETKTRFAQEAGNLKDHELEATISSLREMFAELQEYLGSLKTAFFQRTSSVEIPYLVGLPHSPQKTMGDEILHLVADKVAGSYLDCLEWSSGLVWDEVISYVYPSATGPIGASLRILPHVKTFHLSMSEDGKYFPGALLFLAHETSHVPLYTISNGRTIWSGWVVEMRKNFYEAIDVFTPVKKEILGEAACGPCTYYRFFQELFYEDPQLFGDCVADVLALEIGGICTTLALVDFAPNISTLFRLAFVEGYCKDQKVLAEELIQEETKLSDILMLRGRNGCFRGNPRLCLNLLCEVGEKAGFTFKMDSKNIIAGKLPSLFAEERSETEGERALVDKKQIRQKLCPEFFDLPCDGNCLEDEADVISHVARNRLLFHYDSTLADFLDSGKCLPPETDPKLILHVFYRLYRMKGPPGFSTTMQSLAFCDAKQNERTTGELAHDTSLTKKDKIG